jgi:hypothetical protein
VSAASRLARADKQIVRPPAGSQLGLNSAGVPGGISAVPVDEPLYAGGQNWLPCDAEPWATSIGYQLAVELTRPRVDLVKRQPATAGAA